tara:strand:+ start:2074 stop:3396 length:1323 start_codon:yes stop_codon:yes gene_type:complete
MKNVTFIGAGYVGLVSGTGISDFGHKVTCYDISTEKIKSLKNGEVPIYEPGLQELIKKNTNAGRLFFSNDPKSSIENADVIFIAVGTPLDENGKTDLRYVEIAADLVGQHLNSHSVVCTKSTVPIGTGEKIIKIINRAKKTDVSFDYISNPEFLREGSAVNDFLWPDRIIIGGNNKFAFDTMKEIYGPLFKNKQPIMYTTVTTAEMIKYASNSFLALKISYVNEVANLCESVGADVKQVSKAMGQDGRISSKFLHPGPGYGGSCFPKDTKEFVEIGRKNGNFMRTVEAAIITNEKQKLRMVKKMKKLIGGNFKSKIISILGLSFKPNTDDVRESASIEMIKIIKKEGGEVNAFDPVASDSMKKIFPDVCYKNSWEEACTDADGAVIMTDWNEFRAISLSKLKSIMKTPILLDTRNIIPLENLKENEFHFDNVGHFLLNES